MSSTLPSIVDNCCLTTCDDVVVQNVPGPAGDTGAAGAAGADGVSAYTLLTLAFTMPAEGAGATATVGSTAWMTAGQIVYIAGLGYITATTILSGTTFTATNPENTASGTYASNAAAGTIAAIGSKVSPAGIQGPAGTVSAGTLVGDVTGTIGANELTIAATLGALPVGNGSKAASFSKGSDGEVLCSDAATALDLDWKQISPITGDTDVADNRIGRLNGAAGLPIPIQSSKVTINDQGAITADGSGGNARGTDATDLQVTRGAAAQVASGARAVITGGQNNTASATESAICGGDGNTASGAESFVGGGNGNAASAANSVIVGGSGNATTAVQGAIVGGNSNATAGDYTFIGGGVGNVITGASDYSTIAGGQLNGSIGAWGFVGGGNTNSIITAADYATISGGRLNQVGKSYGAVPGGYEANANLYCSIAHASGKWAQVGDAQTFDIIWRIATTDATANVEMFLDGPSATERAIVGNGSSYQFDIMILARSDAGLDSIYTSMGVIRTNGGVTSVNAVTTTEVYDGIGLAATPVTVDADAANTALRIRVTGLGATNIRWIASGRIVLTYY